MKKKKIIRVYRYIQTVWVGTRLCLLCTSVTCRNCLLETVSARCFKPCFLNTKNVIFLSKLCQTRLKVDTWEHHRFYLKKVLNFFRIYNQSTPPEIDVIKISTFVPQTVEAIETLESYYFCLLHGLKALVGPVNKGCIHLRCSAPYFTSDSFCFSAMLFKHLCSFLRAIEFKLSEETNSRISCCFHQGN